VAKFLILIGSEQASKILAELDPEQVEEISKEIAGIRGITAEDSGEILEEFRSLMALPYGFTGVSYGGPEVCRRILYTAFGAEKGEALLQKAAPEAAKSPFDFLEDFSAEQICLLLREESSAAAALVLSRLPPALSAATLAQFQPARKLEIVHRIAKLGVTDNEVLELVAGALREKARHFGRSEKDAATVDGMNALTAILKHSDISFGDKILDELEHKDPALGQNLKDRLYTLEDLVYADDRSVQGKLRELSDHDLALLLKGRSEAFCAKIFKNISAGRTAQIREEAEILGPVPRREVDAVAGEFLTWFRLGREDGKILLLNSEDIIL
jgi:flagellar motor switch protein FliG